MSSSFPEPIFDPVAVTALKVKAEEAGALDIGIMFATKGQTVRDQSLMIEPGYLVCLTITNMNGTECYQFSVSSKFGLLDTAMMEKFTTAFGLGTRDTWTMKMPPKEGLLRSYSVFKIRGH